MAKQCDFSLDQNTQVVIQDAASRGLYRPDTAKTNFAVPDPQVLRKVDTHIPSEIPPGIIKPSIDIASKQSHKEFVLAVDGKKVSAGLDAKFGDIDLWGYEIPNRSETKEMLAKDISEAKELLTTVQQSITIGNTTVPPCLKDPLLHKL